MFEGTCPQCGRRYFGWALADPERQRCPECGARLEITKSDAGRRGDNNRKGDDPHPPSLTKGR